MFKRCLLFLIILFSLSLAYLFALLHAAGTDAESHDTYLPFATNGPPWPDGCYAPGTRNYRDSLPSPVVQDPVVDQGTVITVTTIADDVNGDVSTVLGLLNDPGPDGLSLREAMMATNNDAGVYTITFAPEIKNGTIFTGGTGNGALPKMLAGSVLINGDIDNDNQPDITLQSAESESLSYGWGIYIASSNQAINAVNLEGFFGAVLINGLESNAEYENISVTNITTKDVNNAIHLATGAEHSSTWESHNQYRNISIIGNRIDAIQYGISVAIYYSTGDTLEDLTIANNSVTVSQGSDTPGDGIGVVAGVFRGSDNNVVTNVLISDNNIEGNWDKSIIISAGAGGGSANTIRGVDIVRNQVKIFDANPEKWAGSRGILLFTADDPSQTNPLTYPENNLITGVRIADNKVEGFWDAGIDLMGSCGGARYNRITNIEIIGNEVQSKITSEFGFGAGKNGIKIAGALGCPDDPLDRTRRPTTDNTVSNVIIQSNRVQIGKEEHVSTNDAIAAGGIVLNGTEVGPAHQNKIENIWVALNEIDSFFPGINMTGGFHDASENVISGVNIYCNTIPTTPISPIWVPGRRGINLSGGFMYAHGNRVEGIELALNNVAGVENDVSVSVNLTDTAIDNVVSYEILPGLP